MPSINLGSGFKIKIGPYEAKAIILKPAPYCSSESCKHPATCRFTLDSLWLAIVGHHGVALAVHLGAAWGIEFGAMLGDALGLLEAYSWATRA